MKWLLGKATGALGLLGGGIPTGWIIAGAVAAVLAVLGMTWKAGFNYAEMEGRAAALELQVQRQAAVIAENTRQQVAVNAIAAGDATRAVIAEGEIRELRKKLLDTPAATAADTGGLSADRVERVRKFRRSPAIRKPQHPANPG